jgi:hypothetical protein
MFQGGNRMKIGCIDMYIYFFTKSDVRRVRLTQRVTRIPPLWKCRYVSLTGCPHSTQIISPPPRWPAIVFLLPSSRFMCKRYGILYFPRDPCYAYSSVHRWSALYCVHKASLIAICLLFLWEGNDIEKHDLEDIHVFILHELQQLELTNSCGCDTSVCCLVFPWCSLFCTKVFVPESECNNHWLFKHNHI